MVLGGFRSFHVLVTTGKRAIAEYSRVEHGSFFLKKGTSFLL